MPNTTIFSAIVPAPFGAIGVRTADALLQELVYLPPSHKPQDPADALAERAAGQIQRYFAEPVEGQAGRGSLGGSVGGVRVADLPGPPDAVHVAVVQEEDGIVR